MRICVWVNLKFDSPKEWNVRALIAHRTSSKNGRFAFVPNHILTGHIAHVLISSPQVDISKTS